MIGLIRKDLFLIVKNLSYIYLLSLIVIIVPITQNPIFLMPILSMLVSLLLATQILGTLGLDEMANWQRNVSAMPITPREEVLSKYLLSIIFALTSVIIVSFFGIAASHILHIEVEIVAVYVLLSFSVGLLYNAIVIPAAYKLGTGKCKYILYFFVAVPTIIPIMFNSLGIKINFEIFTNNLYILAISFLLLTLSLLFISYCISVHIRKKRE